MATGNFLQLLSEPFTRDTPLKLDREKATAYGSPPKKYA
jgi:hypothetical protein